MPRTFYSDFDQRHQVQFTSKIDVGPWDFGVGFNYSTGLPFSLITDFEVIDRPGQPLEYDVEYDGINNYRLDALLEVNLSANGKSFSGWWFRAQARIWES